MPSRAASLGYVPGVLEVVRRAGATRSSLAVRSEPLASTDRVMDVVHVPYGKENEVASQLRLGDGVVSVSRAVYRSALSTTASLTNDPYFKGFSGGTNPPLYEASAVPGQYDLHIICAANAWGYANTNSTGRTYSSALGASGVKIAVIDTGADLTHPELAGRVTYAESDINGVPDSNMADMHDNDGHGTNVAGIIGAAANNNVGFAGVAYNASLLIFRVFPDPPATGCPSGPNPPAQCQANSTDVALAINHAVVQGAKVINLSLGSSSSDPAEESAVQAAVSAGVVVVAAAGNDGHATIDFPAADPGVIAVGASSIDDSNPLSIGEKVASYSNYSAANSNWGIVAPGGDPCCNGNDSDDLHWVENIYTSTAYNSSSMCKPDFGSASGSNDCRVLIAGTSQATPHVAGAAALLLSVGAAPANIKTILCSTANGMPGLSGQAGCGRLNVYRAMAQVVGDPSP